MDLADMQLLKYFTNLEKYKIIWYVDIHINRISEACLFQQKSFVRKLRKNRLSEFSRDSDIIIHCEFF